jgi:amidase
MKRESLALASATAIAIAMSSPALSQAQTASAAPFDVVEASIDGIHTAFRSGRLTAHQLVQAYLDRINSYDKQGPNINSVITLNPNALAEADRLDAAFRSSGFVGPLHGIAILVKDEIDTAGMPTTLGTVVFKARPRSPNSPPAILTARCSASPAILTISSARSAARPAARARR